MTIDMSIAFQAEILSKTLEKCSVTGIDGDVVDLETGILMLCDWLEMMRKDRHSLYVIGNGGSASVAGHAVTDFFNMSKLKAITLHESSLLTCMANDFGYENAFAHMLSQMVTKGDIVIVISSSGQSMNIRNAASQTIENGGKVISLSGFNESNPLRTMGELNFWLDSSNYGIVEIGHQFLLHNISDRLRNALPGQCCE